MKKRTLGVLLLLIAAFAVTGVTLAYWASGFTTNQPENKDEEVVIGEGEVVETTVSVTGGNQEDVLLVPVGREKDGSVSSITFTYSVLWSEATDLSAEGATADLNATAVLGGLADEELALFTVSSFETLNIVYGSTTEVLFTVTFVNEPADHAQYVKVINQILNLTISFELGEVTPA